MSVAPLVLEILLLFKFGTDNEMVDKAWHCKQKDFILLIQNNGDTVLI